MLRICLILAVATAVILSGNKAAQAQVASGTEEVEGAALVAGLRGYGVVVPAVEQLEAAGSPLAKAAGGGK
uniref:PASTA domain-containing protein n=1 Tax=Steinernema glaseri TaxID=37863 RepID=A0A1I7ZF40_9BILA